MAKRPNPLEFKDAAGLTRQERIFVFAYIHYGDALRAALEADVPPAEAKHFAVRAMRNPAVVNALQAEQDRLAVRYAVTAENVVAELAKIGMSNINDYTRLNDDGTRSIDMSNTTPHEMAAVSEIITETRYEVRGRGKDKETIPIVTNRIKMHGKVEALNSLKGILGLNKSQLEVSGTVNVNSSGVSGLLAAVQAKLEPPTIDVSPDRTEEDSQSE